jgi:ABC-type arginine transport system permease subunit
VDYKSPAWLALRLTGVIIMVTAVIALPNAFISLYVWSQGAFRALALTAMVSGLPIVVGLLLIYFPGTIANRMVSGGGETVGTLPLQQVAFSVLGLYFLTSAVADAAYWIPTLGPSIPSGITGSALLASTAVRFVVGLLLLFGGRGLANFVHQLRGSHPLD